jgi:8-oxo-dGTP pyrophosphatase MutT (NUDIX family)
MNHYFCVMKHEIFIKQLTERLVQNLPGTEGHKKMEPITRRRLLAEIHHKKPPRQSAVTIVLFAEGDETRFFLMQRHEYPGVHSGQVSLPGGSVESGDRDLMFTALRETEEETGILAKDIQIIGKLTDLYIPPSNFDVQPFVGKIDGIPDLKPDAHEVQELFSVSVNELINPDAIGTDFIMFHDGSCVEVPCFRFSGHMVWGATAMILSEFRQIIMEIS